MLMNIEQLSAADLDAWVAKSLGYTVVGKALAHYDPEDGHLSLSHDQVPSTGIMATHENYCYVDKCRCTEFKRMEKQEKAFAKEHGFEYKPDRYILGHHWLCLQVVPHYSTWFSFAMEIVRSKRFSLIPVGEVSWMAQKGEVFMIGETEIQAAMRLLVALQFGNQVDNSQLVTQYQKNKKQSQTKK